MVAGSWQGRDLHISASMQIQRRHWAGIRPKSNMKGLNGISCFDVLSAGRFRILCFCKVHVNNLADDFVKQDRNLKGASY